MVEGKRMESDIVPEYEYTATNGDQFYSSKKELEQKEIDEIAAEIHKMDNVWEAHKALHKRVRLHQERNRIKKKHLNT